MLRDRFGEKIEDGCVEVARFDVRFGPGPYDVYRYRRVVTQHQWDNMTPIARAALKEVELQALKETIMGFIADMEERAGAETWLENWKRTGLAKIREKPQG